MPTRAGAFHLFRIAGIDVFLHWSWFVVAVFEVQERTGKYSSVGWNVAEYLALFVIVTLHEFGHALACRQVGGTADTIVLWPLGGVAYVSPPQRPGATLWSIAAGPLVNVALIPALLGLEAGSRVLGLTVAIPALATLIRAVLWINVCILVLNVLPVYPLDGGQILRAILWFPLGRARSLIAATVVGFFGVLGLGLLALAAGSAWIGIVAVFVALNCWQGFQYARRLLRVAKLPRHAGLACPSCGSAPPIGAFWRCGGCGEPFDAFEATGSCPRCQAQFSVTRCVDCGTESPIQVWGGTFAARL